MKPLFSIAVVVITALFLVVPAEGAAMKIGHAAAVGDPRDLGANKVKELMAADASCPIQAQVFPAGQIGGTTDLIEGMQIGSVEMVILPASFMVGFQPVVGVLDFPFFMPGDPQKLLTIHRGPAMRTLLDTTAEKGITSLMIWHTGYKVWTANKPLRNINDFRGLKTRVMPSTVLVDQGKLLGMSTISMPFSETYNALQNGVINAQENPITTTFFMKFHEVQKFITVSNHGTLDQIVMVSKKWHDALSPACKTALAKAVAEGGKVTYDRTYSEITRAKAAFERAGTRMVELSPGEIRALREATLPGIERAYLERTGERGRQIVEAFKKELGN